MTLHPTVLWAQRAEYVYLTVELTDITDPVIELTADKFHFKGKGEKEQKEYECEIEFLKSVDPQKSHRVLTPRGLTMIIIKTDQGYWDKLQKGPRPNYLKVDFNRWRDEDEDEDEKDAPGGGMPDMASLASMMGGGGGGMPDLSSMMGGGAGGGMPDLSSMMGGDMPDLSNMMASNDSKKGDNDEEEAKVTG
ncbi:HSP20-like chaperone [Chlamydoabsidia padenii]|nr:HSP20-like chaperone [Chlamydoabsidia padenii]